MDASFKRLARRQLSEGFANYSKIAAPPPNGWIAAIREALDMTIRQFATRLGIAPSNAIRLEQRERDSTISLGALRRRPTRSIAISSMPSCHDTRPQPRPGITYSMR